MKGPIRNKSGFLGSKRAHWLGDKGTWNLTSFFGVVISGYFKSKQSFCLLNLIWLQVKITLLKLFILERQPVSSISSFYVVTCVYYLFCDLYYMCIGKKSLNLLGVVLQPDWDNQLNYLCIVKPILAKCSIFVPPEKESLPETFKGNIEARNYFVYRIFLFSRV